MNLKIQLLCIVMCCVFFKTQSQSLSNKVVATGGSYSTAAWGSLSATTGEVATATLTSANVKLLQGFQQPTSGLSGITANLNAAPITSLYPNPANSEVFLEFTFPSIAFITYKMYDMNGKELLSENLTTEPMHTTIRKLDISGLSSGIYMLSMYADAESIKNFKIFINH